ncbi:MAG: HAMP domain-containing protein [Betaproteobacteria bacterium]|nr:HAMP domain-containing protein [Betaproteobacteria bacterium]
MPAMDLKRSLLVRITLFAGVISLAAVAAILEQSRTRVRSHIERTGSTIQQLITDEVARSTDAFHRTVEDIDLSNLAAIGELIHFCVEIEDLYRRPVTARCFEEPGYAPAVLHWAMNRLIGSDVIYNSRVGIYPGVKVGHLAVRPDIASEAADAWRQIRMVLGITLGILFLNVLVYWPVRRALRPTDRILAALGRMEAGDLTARLPDCELIELQRISSVFNHLADRLQKTMGEQQKLSERLLTVREEERRHLARELHDEFGQCLASINAEAAYANELALDGVPELLPSAQAIARTTAQMMESLQQILHRLRPVGLDAFGLVAGLEDLVRGWNQRSRGRCRYRLEVEGLCDRFPDNLNINLYRIVQESLTNATRHGDPAEVVVRISCGESIELTIDDDGRRDTAHPAEPGHGVLGMHERVQALGGIFSLSSRDSGGTRVKANIPLAAAAGASP